MLKLAARYANAWNIAWYTRPARVEEEYLKLLEACKVVGRDPEAIDLTVGTRMHLLAPGQRPEPDTRMDRRFTRGSGGETASICHHFPPQLYS